MKEALELDAKEDVKTVRRWEVLDYVTFALAKVSGCLGGAKPPSWWCLFGGQIIAVVFYFRLFVLPAFVNLL